MEFKNPSAFLLFLPLIAVWIRFLYLYYKGGFHTFFSVPSLKAWQERSFEKKSFLKNPRVVLSFIYFVSTFFLIIATARPQAAFKQIKRDVNGIDILLVLDLSASMGAEDFRGKSRIEVAKPIMDQFVQDRMQ